MRIVSAQDVETPPHPDCFAIRPLPARGERLDLGSVHLHPHLSPLAGRGRLASSDARRVRGRLRRQRGRYDFQYARHVAQHVVVPESQDSIIVLRKPSVANYVTRIVRMLSAIDFNDEPMLAANQVDRVWSNRFLPNEFVAIELARSQPVPQLGFRVGRGSSQPPSPISFNFIGLAHVETPPHPARFACRPLPARGERLSSHGAA
jgi:hypothetical protein